MKYRYAFLTVFCLIDGCAATGSNRQSPIMTGAEGQPALHAVQDQALRDLMDRMRGLMLERFMTEHEMDIERGRFAEQIRRNATALVTASEDLLNKLPGLGLNSQQESAFRILSVKLGQQAGFLRKQAEENRFNAMSATLHEMHATCMACHALFRKL